jgi:hypothetical protein
VTSRSRLAICGPAGPAESGGLEPLSIAVQWVVFSGLSTDAMVATGITDEPSTARWMVETILADTSHAGWGEVHRVPVPGEIPSEAEQRPLTGRPPALEGNSRK